MSNDHKAGNEDIKLARNTSIIVAKKSKGREKYSSNLCPPKTKKHAFLRATNMGNRGFGVRMGL